MYQPHRAENLLPKVGLIVPIYNVEKYLVECLDSLLNQSYENLEIVLVDDKSTDSSLSIAKEYVKRDRRVSLIALGENSGQSVARNVAMDYLSGESYRQKVEQRLRGGGAVYRHIGKHDGGGGLGEREGFLNGLAGDLIEDCDGEGARDLARDSARVEFIHFIDSDDWLERDCIERCVELARKQDAQIVFHWRRLFNDTGVELELGEDASPVALWGLRDGGVYSGLEIFKSLRSPSFSWATLGIMRLDFLNALSLRFEQGIESEDALFGMQLFAQSERIAMLDARSYIYRLRPNSTSHFTLNEENRCEVRGKDSFPSSRRDLVEAFCGNVYLVRHYSFSYSCAVISLKMVEFMEAHREELSPEMMECLERFISHRMIFAFHGCEFGSDPRGVREICRRLWRYGDKASIFSKLACYFPRLFHGLKYVKNKLCR